MVQKVLAARTSDAQARADAGELVDVQIDQIVLARTPGRVLGEALAGGLKRSPVEVAVAYNGRCVGLQQAPGAAPEDSASAGAGEMLAHGIVVARAGVGFPAPVHLERFASPARLCVTDEPRLAGVGGIGMLTLVVPTSSLARGLAQGAVLVRVPVSVQVVLSGRLRPFVCARDVSLELLRRGLGEVVRRVEEAKGAPVVLEFTGPSVRSLSVAERAVLAALAPQLGAAAAVFVSDERTEVFLRDQRRSKAHRALAADAGAPNEESVNVDLGAVDPLVLDENGQVRAVRDLAGRPVSQVLLGGDSGTTLRDLFAAATLLKSKRVPSRLDFLLATPSRQMLEVLASAGALTDLIATGARLVEPDARVVSGDLYTPARSGAAAMQTCDPEPRPGRPSAPLVGSAETLAFAVATGEVGDPRSFKRPVRVTVPRTLPTDDVLVARKAERGDARLAGTRRERPEPARAIARGEGLAAFPAWRAAQTLELVDRAAFVLDGTSPALPERGRSLDGTSPALPERGRSLEAGANGHSGVAVVCTSLDEVRELAARAPEIAHSVRAVLAAYIPSSLVALLSAVGIAAIRLDPAAAKVLKGQKTIVLPAWSCPWPRPARRRGPATSAEAWRCRRRSSSPAARPTATEPAARSSSVP